MGTGVGVGTIETEEGEVTGITEETTVTEGATATALVGDKPTDEAKEGVWVVEVVTGVLMGDARGAVMGGTAGPGTALGATGAMDGDDT